MILSPRQEYMVREVSRDNRGELALSVDGCAAGVIGAGQAVLIRAADKKAKFIDLGLRDFYRRVDLKLRVGNLARHEEEGHEK